MKALVCFPRTGGRIHFFAGYAFLQEREDETTTMYNSFFAESESPLGAQVFLQELENDTKSSFTDQETRNKIDAQDFLHERKKVTNPLFCKLDTRDFVPTDTVEVPYMHGSLCARRHDGTEGGWQEATSACLH